jgi:hypothetical protein
MSDWAARYGPVYFVVVRAELQADDPIQVVFDLKLLNSEYTKIGIERITVGLEQALSDDLRAWYLARVAQFEALTGLTQYEEGQG